MMNNSDYITILCGEFDDNYVPLTRSAFWKLFRKYNNSLDDLLNSGEDQVETLLQRSASVSFAINNLNQMGFHITTFLDADFPKRLLDKLNNDDNSFCPPLLYTCGNSALNKRRFIGYVGSRSVTEEEIHWTEMCVAKNVRKGYGIVTGGAKGIDSAALNCAIRQGGFAVVYLPDNIKEKARDHFYQQNLLRGNILLYSHISPIAPKTKNSFIASAMERNKFIYAQSDATVVVRTDFEKGGTWAGAVEALKHNWTTVYIWDNKNYQGNQELIYNRKNRALTKKAKALSDEGNPVDIEESQPIPVYEQMPLF